MVKQFCRDESIPVKERLHLSLILLTLGNNKNLRNGYSCTVGYGHLEEMTGASPRQLMRKAQELENEGTIEISKNGRGNRNTYTLKLVTPMCHPTSDIGDVTRTSDTKDVTHNKNMYKELNNKKNTASPTLKGRGRLRPKRLKEDSSANSTFPGEEGLSMPARAEYEEVVLEEEPPDVSEFVSQGVYEERIPF